MPEYKLPDVGEGLTEAEIVTWKVKVGDVIAVNDIVVEIETAKSLVELPCPYAGTVAALLVNEGETVDVGTPIIAVGDAARGAGGAAPAAPAPAGAAEIDLSNPAASRRRRGREPGRPQQGRARGRCRAPRQGRARPPCSRRTSRCRRRSSPGASQSPEVVEADEPAVPAHTPPRRRPRAHGDVRTLAKPPVRKLAKDLGVDLASLTASGRGWRGHPGGRGGCAAAARAVDATPARPATAPTDQGASARPREPIKGVRKMMGQAMVESAFSAPHVTEWVTIDVTRTMEFVERLKTRREFRDVKVSPLLVLARACMLAMRRTPEINSWWDEPAQEVVFKRYVNLGIAAATPRGLVVPNVKDAQDALAARARRGAQPAHRDRPRRARPSRPT